MIPYIPTQDTSPYLHLDGHIFIPISTQTNASKFDISKEIKEHNAKRESQEHMNHEISAPLKLKCIPSPLHE